METSGRGSAGRHAAGRIGFRQAERCLTGLLGKEESPAGRNTSAHQAFVTLKVRVSPASDRDIDGHIVFIARERPEAAHRFIDALAMTFDHIARMPGMGLSSTSPRHG